MSKQAEKPEAEQTWCGIFRCCRERDHEGACEEDETMLDNWRP